MCKIIINIIIYIILSILINKIFSKKKSSSNLKKYITYISLMTISSVIYFYLKEFENNFFIISIFLNISILTIYILIFKKYKDDKSIKLKNILY